ncbi:MAG: MATE family efflux transporter [Gammaproteobacteria bacterium]|nr:MATE family efflux transporter [Gammaproteobacteria bacterium]NHN37985.1 MATE family efflux transporter [Pseudomaricurvus alcaniphilus]
MAKPAVSFTQGDPGWVLYHMSLPMVWGLLATMSFNAVDTYFVAQLGSAQLAAMSFTFPVVMVVTSLAIGLGAGTSSVIARLLGEERVADARQVAADSLLLALALSVVMMVLGLLTIEPLFTLLGAEPALLPLIRQYMEIWYFNTPFVIVPMALSALMRAAGHNQVAGNLMLVAALFNLLLDPLLIFGWGVVPRLEIAGAAWATLITRGLIGVVSLYWVSCRLQLTSWPHRQWSNLLASWRSVLHIGLPAMATNMIIPLASGITVALVAGHGVDAVAGYGVAVRIEPVVLIAFYALSGVIGPFLGQNMAAHLRPRQQQALRAIVRFSLVFGLLLALLLALAGRFLAGLFSDSSEVIAIAAVYLWIVPISYGAYGLVMSVNAAFNGLGLPLPAMTISILRVLVLYLPLALLGQWLFGLKGLFLGTAIANLLVGLLGYAWLKKTMHG